MMCRFLILILVICPVCAINTLTERVMLRSDTDIFTFMRHRHLCFHVDPSSGNAEPIGRLPCKSIEGWAHTTDMVAAGNILDRAYELSPGSQEHPGDFAFFSFINHFLCIIADPFKGNMHAYTVSNSRYITNTKLFAARFGTIHECDTFFNPFLMEIKDTHGTKAMDWVLYSHHFIQGKASCQLHLSSCLDQSINVWFETQE